MPSRFFPPLSVAFAVPILVIGGARPLGLAGSVKDSRVRQAPLSPTAERSDRVGDGVQGPVAWLALSGRSLLKIEGVTSRLRVFRAVDRQIREVATLKLPIAAGALAVRQDSVWLTEPHSGATGTVPMSALLDSAVASTEVSLRRSPQPPRELAGFLPWSRTSTGWLALEGVPMDEDATRDKLPVVRATVNPHAVRLDTVAFFRSGRWMFRVDERLALPYQPFNDGDLLELGPSGDKLLIVRRDADRADGSPRGAYRIVTWDVVHTDSTWVTMSYAKIPIDARMISEAREQVRRRFVGVPVAPSALERALR